MGLGLGGLQSGSTSIASVLAGLVGQDVVARSFSASQASGSDAFKATVNGARWHIGAGASDYLSSDGTTITFASGIAIAANVSALAMAADSNRISWSGGLNLDANSGLRSNNGFNSTAGTWNNNARMWMHSSTAPTVAAGAGASVTSNNGTAAFTIDLGGAAQTGTITLPTATTGWVVYMQNVTTPASFILSQTGGTTTTATFTCYDRASGLAANWTANDVARCIAIAY